MFSGTALEQGVRRPSLLLYLPCQPVPARGYLSVDKSVDNLGSHRQGNVHPTSDSHIVLGLTSEVFPPLVATASCTGAPKETPTHVARFLPGYCRPQVVAAEAGGLILRSTMLTAGRWFGPETGTSGSRRIRRSIHGCPRFRNAGSGGRSNWSVRHGPDPTSSRDDSPLVGNDGWHTPLDAPA